MSARRFHITHGDCTVEMAAMRDAGALFDAIVTDPPYELGFMGKGWDKAGVAFDVAMWRMCWDLLPPGGHLLAFGGTRTFHRMAVAIEDAGFEIRDTLMWLYGTGFPKSHDVSKGIDKALGVQGGFGGPKTAAHAGWIDRGRMRGDDNEEGWQRPWMEDPEAVDRNAREYLPGSEAAQRFKGWGTALKPAWEPIIVARKPLAGTVAQNVLAHGTGAINVDGCRVAIHPDGRWPANVVHDGSDEVEAVFAAFGERPGQQGRARTDGAEQGNVVFGALRHVSKTPDPRGDAGTASRFFYSAKASKADRMCGDRPTKHPTVKPIALMRWLVRLVTPPGGTVLDPFAGSGTTMQAALAEGFCAHGIEQDGEYVGDIQRRLARANTPEPEGLPLFAAEAQQ